MGIVSQVVRDPAFLYAMSALVVTVVIVSIRNRSTLFGPSKRRLPTVNILTIRDTADVCGVSVREVRRWIERGLSVVRIGRVELVRPRDLEMFFADHVQGEIGLMDPDNDYGPDLDRYDDGKYERADQPEEQEA